MWVWRVWPHAYSHLSSRSWAGLFRELTWPLSYFHNFYHTSIHVIHIHHFVGARPWSWLESNVACSSRWIQIKEQQQPLHYLVLGYQLFTLVGYHLYYWYQFCPASRKCNDNRLSLWAQVWWIPPAEWSTYGEEIQGVFHSLKFSELHITCTMIWYCPGCTWMKLIVLNENKIGAAQKWKAESVVEHFGVCGQTTLAKSMSSVSGKLWCNYIVVWLVHAMYWWLSMIPYQCSRQS